MRSTSNKYAFGFCDRTGFRYPLNDLVDEYKNGVKTGLRVGRDVADDDHPQNFLGRIRIFYSQSISNFSVLKGSSFKIESASLIKSSAFF